MAFFKCKFFFLNMKLELHFLEFRNETSEVEVYFTYQENVILFLDLVI